MKLLERILDKFLLKHKSFRNYINYRYDFSKPGLIPPGGYYWKDSLKFKFAESLINDTDWECYDISVIRPDDIVLDIGATGGGFAMHAARTAKHVYAVEPLYTDVLKENLKINSINNITVLDMALGFYGERELEYACSVYKKSKTVQFMSLTDIIKICGGHVDFLKLDCEGGEWYIKPDELKGIRQIEAETHSFEDMPRPEKFLKILDIAGFNYTKKVLNDEQMIVHAKKH